ncbi:uncharacterized protein LOC119349073 isoform X2 [Triticum dicoccoides]|nr:uncharacterized protein LOC119349073 isoform X2 [Triticum dicoccoides]
MSFVTMLMARIVFVMRRFENRRPRRGTLVDDSNWREVVFANSYGLLIGYLSMAVKGLGFLVLTWTTVVLLGGYVSTLKKKDFWSLAFITLVQTAGIFDVLLTEKLSYIWDSVLAILSIRYAVIDNNPLQRKRQVLANVLALVQLVLFVILLCPLAAVYMFGLLISSGISVWRLIQHDYGRDADGLGNLKPALDVLYSIALLQGVIFCYKTVFGFAEGPVVNRIVKAREFGDEARVGISDYLHETIVGCEKDPSFARGRNLITYAIDLMWSKSPNDYVSGVRILDAFARRMEMVGKKYNEENIMYDQWTLKRFMEEHILMKHQIMSASSAVLQKLLQTLSLRSMCDRETRGCAARIVANIAQGIRLDEFPRGVDYISSLINTFQAYSLLQPYQLEWAQEIYQQKWDKMAPHLRSLDRDAKGDSDGELLNAHKELMVQGFRILGKLATNNDNCRIMLDTPRLLQKIMAPVTSDLLHQIDHDAWHSIVEGSLKVIINLMVAATGKTGTMLRSKISSSKEAISTIGRILECDKCDQKLQEYAILVLRFLYMDTSLILENAGREKFIEMLLVDIMTDDNKDKEDRRAAAASALIALCSKTETGAKSIIMANDNVVNNLTIMILENGTFRLIATEILEYLCIHCTSTNDDENVKRLKKVMTDAVTKVLGEIVCWASEETQTGTLVDQVRFQEPETDLENQSGDSQVNAEGNNTSSSNQQDRKLSEYGVMICLLSLCVTVCETLISADQDLTPLFESTTPMDGVSSFPMKLKQIVGKYMHRRSEHLAILKLT